MQALRRKDQAGIILMRSNGLGIRSTWLDCLRARMFMIDDLRFRLQIRYESLNSWVELSHGFWTVKRIFMN